MTKIVRTNSEHPYFIELVKKLDFYLALKDGEEHHFYAQFNKISALHHCVVLYEEDQAVGCGAIKPYDATSMEVKRMYVDENFRKKGYASQILEELEHWTKELGYTSTILETGIRQTEAVKFYEKTYEKIPNFGQYIGVENSVCFKKTL